MNSEDFSLTVYTYVKKGQVVIFKDRNKQWEGNAEDPWL